MTSSRFLIGKPTVEKTAARYRLQVQKIIGGQCIREHTVWIRDFKNDDIYNLLKNHISSIEQTLITLGAQKISDDTLTHSWFEIPIHNKKEKIYECLNCHTQTIALSKKWAEKKTGKCQQYRTKEA